MTRHNNIKLIVIGGSAGSIPVVNYLLSTFPEKLNIPVVICLHRMKQHAEGMKEVFESIYRGRIAEPNDKEPILPGYVYIAPANYHLLFNNNGESFCLSTDELVNFSRPAIDLTFYSAAKVFKKECLGIILSGANKDGAAGMLDIYKKGGLTIAQDPAECPAPYMPQYAIGLKCIHHILSREAISHFILSVSNNR